MLQITYYYLYCHEYVICILKYNTLISLIYRRSTEFSNAIKQTFETAVLVELFPRSQIDIYVQILQSDGGKLNFIVRVVILIVRMYMWFHR